MDKWHEDVRNAVTGVPYVASVGSDNEYAVVKISEHMTVDDLPTLVDEVQTNLDDMNVPHRIVSFVFVSNWLILERQEVTPRDVMVAYLQQRYTDDDYVEEYIAEAEHQEGKSFWRMFSDPKELYTDFELYRTNADLLGKATPGVTK